MFGLTDPGQQKSAMIAILILGAVVLFYQYGWAPLRAERGEVEHHLDALSQTNDRARAVTHPERIASLRKRESEYRVAMETYDEILPPAAEVPGLLSQVAAAALAEHVEIVHFSPLEPRAEEDLVEFPFDLRVQGRYHEIGHFLAAVINLPRIVRPEVMALESVRVEPESEFEEPRYEVLASILLSAYARSTPLEGEAVAPPADAATRPTTEEEEVLDAG